MRCLILTQDDPFYLAENLDYLFSNFPDSAEISGCVVFDVSPFGKRESFTQKMKKTIKVFGFGFFIKYGFDFVKSKFNPNKSVIKVLKKWNVPLINIQGSINSKKSLEILASFNPDLLISIAGNQIFKEKLINLAPKGTINLHTALLPKYRGLMPSFWVLKNNEKETGVSVFFVDEGIDSGPIIVQKRIEIHDSMSQMELIRKSKKIGMNAIIEAVELIEKNEVNLIENPDGEMTYFSFPTKNDVIEFKKAGKKFY